MRLGQVLLRKLRARPQKIRRAKLKTSSQVIARVRPSVNSGQSLEQTNPQLLSVQALIRPDNELLRAIEGFLLNQRSEHTRRSYQKDLKRFVKFLVVMKNQQPSRTDISRNLIISYKEFLLSEKLQHTTVDRHLATLKSFFSWLVEENLVTKNPTDGVRFLNPKKLSSTQGLTDEQVRNVLAQPDLHTRVGAQHYAILMILFYCGLRRSELCFLKTENISTEKNRRLLKLLGKGNQERVIPLISSVVNAIEYYAKMNRINLDEPGFLFRPLKNNRTQVFNKPLDPSSIFYVVTRYSKRAGVHSRISPHSCRATAISHARDRQVSDRAIQEFAGWSSTEMIVRYDKRKNAIENSAALVINYDEENQIVADK